MSLCVSLSLLVFSCLFPLTCVCTQASKPVSSSLLPGEQRYLDIDPGKHFALSLPASSSKTLVVPPRILHVPAEYCCHRHTNARLRQSTDDKATTDKVTNVELDVMRLETQEVGIVR